MIDFEYEIGKGEFENAAFLIKSDKVNPSELIIDPSTGAKIAHFAAHHGDVKFMRWLIDDIIKKAINKEETLKRFREDKDMYGCSLVVYAAR